MLKSASGQQKWLPVGFEPMFTSIRDVLWIKVTPILEHRTSLHHSTAVALCCFKLAPKISEYEYFKNVIYISI